MRLFKRLKDPFKLKNKKGKFWSWKTLKRGLFYTFLIVLFLLTVTFAWASKDLPTPNSLKNRKPAQSSVILDRNGKVLYNIYGDQKRTVIASDQIPDTVKKATVSAEDKNFYQHHGLDFRGIARAAYYDITRRSGMLAGGSTITQQFVKNAVLDPQQTFGRKVKELAISLELEAMYNKDQILTMYLNEIPYGSNAYGIEAAADTFFGKHAKDLTLAETATLVALPKAPTYYSPYGGHTDQLKLRQEYVLDRMAADGNITQAQADQAKQDKIAFVQKTEDIKAPHFVMYVRELLAEQFGDQAVEQGGFKVTTSLDLDEQEKAEQTVKNSASKINAYGASNAAMVSIDANTGEIMSMVGSIDYFDMAHDGNVNVTIANRQPGSSFKPVVYSTAFKGQWSPGSTLWDVPTDFNGYKPTNYNGKTNGPLSIRQCLANSLNIPAVKMLSLAGMNNSLATAKDMGITTLNDPDRYGLSLVLGGGEVQLTELAGAYTVFAQGGVKHPLRPILKIEDSNGKLIKDYSSDKPAQVLDPGIAYEINSILSDNNARSLVFGTHTALYFPNRTVAAKTGTTSEFRDAWAFGYTPNRVTGVWVGNNDDTPMRTNADGSVVAAPIMHTFMDQVLAGQPDAPFSKPSNIQNVTLDKLSGKLPGSNNSGTRNDIATSWQIPKEKDNSGSVKVKINTIDNKLATADCPDSIVKEMTFANVHSERPDVPAWENPVRAWAKANGIGGLPPTETTTLCGANQHPTISFSAPADGDTVSGDTAISVNVNAPLSVDRVEFYIDNLPIGNVSSAPFTITYDMSNLAPGDHTILARVFDRASFSAEASIKVTVSSDNLPPGNVSGVSVSSGTGSITLSWTNPSDADLSRVRVYFSTASGSLGTLFGTQVTAGAGSHSSITITGLHSGTPYYFTIRPVDSSGNENGSSTQYSGTPG